MHAIDFLVIAAYVVGCTVLGARLGASSGGGLKGYFLGESNIPAWAVMISIVATETSAVTFLSVPGIAYRGDMTFLQLAIGYILARIAVARLLLPAYFKGEIYTAYQVLALRFGGATQKAASVLFLITRTLGSGLRLFLAARVLEYITGWPLSASILVIGISTLVYTYLGGLKGVIWADVLQFAVYMLGAGVALVVLGRAVPGGWEAVFDQAGAAGKFRVFNFSTDLTIPYTFWAGAIGAMVLDMGTHGADQMMVQRYLSARSQRQAAGALIVSGFVILLQFAVFLTLGAGIWTLYQSAPPDLLPQKDQEFASFIIRYLPTGVLGLVIAAVFSVTMSTVSGALSASASSTINDLYRPLFPDTPEPRLLRLSKALTLAWGVAQIGVAFGAMGLNQAVIDNALAIASFVTGILLGLFLLALLTTRVGQGAAFAGMLAGLAAVSYCAFGTKLAYPWYAVVGSATVFAVGLLASYLRPEPSPSPTAKPAPLQELT
jgi:SSS family transporter